MRFPIILPFFVIIITSLGLTSSTPDKNWADGKFESFVLPLLFLRKFTSWLPIEEIRRISKEKIIELKKINFKDKIAALEKNPTFEIGKKSGKGEKNGDENQRKCQAKRHPRLEYMFDKSENCLNELNGKRQYLLNQLKAAYSRIQKIAKEVHFDLTREQHIELWIRIYFTLKSLNEISEQHESFTEQQKKCREQMHELKLTVREKQEDERKWKRLGVSAMSLGAISGVLSFFAPASIVANAWTGGSLLFGAYTYWDCSTLIDELDELVKCIDNNRMELSSLHNTLLEFKHFREEFQRELEMLQEVYEVQEKERQEKEKQEKERQERERQEKERQEKERHQKERHQDERYKGCGANCNFESHQDLERNLHDVDEQVKQQYIFMKRTKKNLQQNPRISEQVNNIMQILKYCKNQVFDLKLKARERQQKEKCWNNWGVRGIVVCNFGLFRQIWSSNPNRNTESLEQLDRLIEHLNGYIPIIDDLQHEFIQLESETLALLLSINSPI